MDHETIKRFEELAAGWYTQGYRPYHNFAHVNVVQIYCNRISDNDPALELAALYHDAIYIPGFYANEDASSDVLGNDAKKLRNMGYEIDDAIIKCAQMFISHTTIKDHLIDDSLLDWTTPLEQKHHILLDADLSSLSLSWKEFLDNQQNIILENFGNTETDLVKQAKFLNQFLSCRKYIYHTKYFRHFHEETARENIKQLIKITK